ncbi:MAG: membrane protein insertion efficiency factor YidD [Chloroflexi bacterium]|nr:membrane protein insertion efficiency factor YidD [Chloroflexota bacterium]
MRRAALGAITLYQLTLSQVVFQGVCRFYPSCSQYTYEAIQQYGVPKGVWLGIKRLSRCRPFGSSGYDPVP